MAAKNKTPADAEALETSGDGFKAKHNKSLYKIYRIMAAFARGESLNFIEAQRLYSDRSLHSTVSEIQQDHQLIVERKAEVVAGFMGISTRCKRYWMEPSNRVKAKKILAVLA
jgi:hypothetical protein